MFEQFLGSFFPKLAIDLGTANTLVFQKGQGVIIREPSVVARQKKSGEVLAVGKEAKEMIGKTPEAIEAFYPLRDGVIADFDAARAMISYHIDRAIGKKSKPWNYFFKPLVVIGTPSGATEVERRAVFDAVSEAGAGSCFLVEEPMAAAIGAGLSIERPNGALVCDIGGGTTEIAVISLSGIVLNRSLKLAGYKMDKAVVNFLRLKYSLVVGETTAEEIKTTIGTAVAPKKEKVMVVRGQSLENGLPTTIRITSVEVREAIAPILNQIIGELSEVIEATPPELMGDFLEKGITLCGGVANLPGIDRLFSREIKMPVFVADDPQAAVVLGCGKLLENAKLREKVKVNID
ncbi:rod shape-determining protein [Candidatus Shapirobacteria bacterium CG09_land_8_20_14_0_10_38_17]|uniref:Cell shape-determining protein MreB n=1 Tax=Candidatus Shapirobacteria bacterium CG09_land_8_20_14_0_10_38_17 TaxID=1974884 RepID=A0A2H0WR93_9BACT|nr:MAG: rod shape-determining protein [Candidatus Shapirobacteria bacterium CG09_land_8_20_14_0_10_38_17]